MLQGIFADLVSHKMKNEIPEMSDIRRMGVKYVGMLQSMPILICFSLSVCYRYIGVEEKRDAMVDRMSIPIVFSFLNNHEGDFSDWHYAYLLLMFDVFENSDKWKILHYLIYKKIISNKIKLIGKESAARKYVFEKHIFLDHWRDTSSLGSCNVNMNSKFKLFTDNIPRIGEISVKTIDNREYILLYKMAITADTIYYTQFLIVRRKLEQAISLLKVILEQEGDFSISMVI